MSKFLSIIVSVVLFIFVITVILNQHGTYFRLFFNLIIIIIISIATIKGSAPVLNS